MRHGRGGIVSAHRDETGDEVDTLLASITPGEVRTIFASPIEAAIARLRTYACATGRATVVHCWRQVPDVHAIVDQAVAALATAALDAWPDWYFGASMNFVSGNGTEAAVFNDIAIRAVLGFRREVNAAWLRSAVARCAENRVPLLPEFGAALQVFQLSRALSSDGPIVAMVVEVEAESHGKGPAAFSGPRLRAFANAATWLSKEAGARLIAVLPEHLARNVALDSVAYASCHLESASAGRAEDRCREVTTVWPVLGRPHPSSRGECVLAERLVADPELRALFHFNKRVGTVRNTMHLVDLVWPAGRVIVEVDGWGHLMPRNYRGDRYR